MRCRRQLDSALGTIGGLAVVDVIVYEAGRRDSMVGTMFKISVEPLTEKCAGGAGSIEIGPSSIRQAPSTMGSYRYWVTL